MKKIYLIAFLLFNFNFINAQNWTVGVPVDMSISYLTRYAFGCAPQPDFSMNIVLPNVTGIQYLAIVDSVQDIAVIVSNNDTLLQGDTLVLSPGDNNYSVSFLNGTGNISFNFKAIGTPSTAGQTHPCAFNDIWMSNLLLCNEGLTLNVPTNCTVDAATAISSLENNASFIQFPNSGNHFQLQLNNNKSYNFIGIYDITGKQIFSNTTSHSGTISIPCEKLNSGIYFIKLNQNNTFSTHKFVINK